MYKTLIYEPLYNALIFITAHTPGINLGIAIVIFTILVRVVLFPISKSATETQMKMKLIAPQLEEINKQHKDNAAMRGAATMQLYRDNKIKLFSPFFFMLIQIPILWALISIFNNGHLPGINSEVLYGAVNKVSSVIIDTNFLGIDLVKKSVLLGIIAGLLQFLQIQLTMPSFKKPDAPKKAGEMPSFKDDLAKSMHFNMKFTLPVIVFVAALQFTGAVSLYWIVSTIFTIGQELYFRRTIKKDFVQ
jgi:YidC/Oxa1 family membrane protein insertase